jgi:hypothetical protein
MLCWGGWTWLMPTACCGRGCRSRSLRCGLIEVGGILDGLRIQAQARGLEAVEVTTSDILVRFVARQAGLAGTLRGALSGPVSWLGPVWLGDVFRRMSFTPTSASEGDGPAGGADRPAASTVGAVASGVRGWG